MHLNYLFGVLHSLSALYQLLGAVTVYLLGVLYLLGDEFTEAPNHFQLEVFQNCGVCGQVFLSLLSPPPPPPPLRFFFSLFQHKMNKTPRKRLLHRLYVNRSWNRPRRDTNMHGGCPTRFISAAFCIPILN